MDVFNGSVRIEAFLLSQIRSGIFSVSEAMSWSGPAAGQGGSSFQSAWGEMPPPEPSAPPPEH